MSATYQDYVAHMRKLTDIQGATAVLAWDKEVYLPKKGAGLRAQQMATLSGLAHELFVDSKFEAIIQELTQQDLGPKEARNVAKTKRELEKTQKLDKAFVIKRSQAVSKGYHAWLEAREKNDFASFQAPLADLIEIKKEQAERIGYQDHPYDALLDDFEPGARAAALDKLFEDVRSQLVDFVQSIRSKPPVDNQFLFQSYAKDRQWDFGLDLLRGMGYDFDAGRQDLSPHPFTINFSSQDVRVTTRIDEKDLGNMAWSCIHEGGHALYEQGLPVDQYGLPSGKAVSLGIHESQSRLWENQVGRSLPFWKHWYIKAQAYFPTQLADISLEKFYKGINKIEAGLIRTEADELHYHFHVMIRYELEKRLLEGSLAVKDLRDAWNQRYKDYLNIDVPNDQVGVLQDIHWAHGSFGYFPTYSLGSFYAAQFFHQAMQDIDGLQDHIEGGNTAPLLDWLRTNIHQHGQFYTADELCEKITGEKLNFTYFMDYVREKYATIYP